MTYLSLGIYSFPGNENPVFLHRDSARKYNVLKIEVKLNHCEERQGEASLNYVHITKSTIKCFIGEGNQKPTVIYNLTRILVMMGLSLKPDAIQIALLQHSDD